MSDPSYEVLSKRGQCLVSYSDDKDKDKDKVLKSRGSKDIKYDIQTRLSKSLSRTFLELAFLFIEARELTYRVITRDCDF